YISPGDMRRLGLIGVIAVLAVLIFKLVLPEMDCTLQSSCEQIVLGSYSTNSTT
ncbi:unnamed protein product, partial [marine sediment metagenome]